MGMNHMALVNRWQALMGGLGVLSSVIVVLAGGKLLAVTCCLQFWALINTIRNRWLAMHVDEGRLTTFTRAHKKSDLFPLIWSRAWRSGLGITVLFGFSQSFGFVIAQFMSPQIVAPYMFASRI